MTDKDWEILPAPSPWRSISKYEYDRRWGLAVILWTPCVVMFASWIWLGFKIGNFFHVGMLVFLLIGSTSLIIGLIVQYRLYQKSTDGIDNWMIVPPRSSDLCIAMETAFDDMLKNSGFHYSPGKLKTVTINYITNRQYGRNYIVRLKQNGHMNQQGFKYPSNNHSIVFDFAYRPGNKYESPYLTIELRDITRINYNDVITFQKRVVETLDSLNYQSFPDTLWK